jgi:two-component system response regulator FixJ
MTAQPDVCIIDDDPSVLDSLEALLESHGLVVGAHASAEAFLERIDAGLTPGSIVSDIRLGGMSGLDLQQELLRRRCRSPLILITGHGQVSMAVAAIKAGAEDFIEKPFDGEGLVEAIRRALAKASKEAEAERTREELAERIAQLSQRQREVMDLVVRGYSSKEIAAKLGISPRTVETYRLWIMERTGARNLAELVRMVMQVEPAPPA